MTPSHIRLVESHARLAGAVRMLKAGIDGDMGPNEAVEAARTLIAQSEEWLAASDEKVRGIIDGAGGSMSKDAAEVQQDANKITT